MKVYMLISKDPYDEHDHESIEGIYVNIEDVVAARLDKFAYTFGKEAAYTKQYPHDSFMIDKYSEIKEIEVQESYETPEWIASALERRAKDKAEFEARFPKTN
jgi:hypothetical protein